MYVLYYWINFCIHVHVGSSILFSEYALKAANFHLLRDLPKIQIINPNVLIHLILAFIMTWGLALWTDRCLVIKALFSLHLGARLRQSLFPVVRM